MTTIISHTPGPWLAAAKPSSIVGWPVVAPRAMGRSICSVTIHDEAEANARLIAAAPDLLAVAKECLELAKLAESLCGCRGDDDYVWGIQERLNAALAKAEARP